MSATGRNPRATIRRILDAAEREFQEFGLDGARIARIAESASTSKQIIYNYFINTGGLYLAVINDLTARHRETMLKEDLSSQDPGKDLKKFIEILFDIMASHEGRVESKVLISGAGLPVGGVYLRGQRKVIALLESIIRRGQKDAIFIQDVNVVDLFVFITTTAAALNAARTAMSEIKAFHTSNPYPEGFWRSYLSDLVLAAVSVERGISEGSGSPLLRSS